jgi:cytochrome c oxidase accessory protein FixG
MPAPQPPRHHPDGPPGAGAPPDAAPKPRVIPIQAEVVESLYQKRKEIYPRARFGDRMGTFQKWRWAFIWLTQLVFYGLPWLPWNGRQAVLFELAQRKFYLFGLVLWPQDVIYLTGILIISALSLFLFTAIGGRLWCGYACPQTVYTELFMWVERAIEGDRAKRMALDKAPWSARKLGLKSAKHAAWVAVAAWTGFTFVGFFTPIRDLGPAVLSLDTSGWESFWILFYGFATYGNAGWMREQVCKYMCPYARFQSSMFDKDTLIVTYDVERGEPRGAASKSQNRAEKGFGDCLDCSICVQVCPTGIDIRNGLQYECIGCAACIDGCNWVMDKAGLPRGLVRYTTTNALDRHYGARQVVKHVLRPRTMVYGAILLSVIAAVIVSIAIRVPLKVDVIRDRGSMSREVEDGLVENVYRLQVMNTGERRQVFSVTAEGLPGIAVASDTTFEVPAATTTSIPLRLRVAGDRVPAGSTPVHIQVVSRDDPSVRVREKSVFMGPRR